MIDGDDIFRFCEGCLAVVALIVAFRLGRLGGSAIRNEVCGSVNGSGKSAVVSVGGFGGAGTTVFFGLFGILTRSAGDTFERIDDTQLVSLLKRLCFIFLSPSVFRLASFAYRLINYSVVFSFGIFGLSLA